MGRREMRAYLEDGWALVGEVRPHEPVEIDRTPGPKFGFISRAASTINGGHVRALKKVSVRERARREKAAQ